MECPNEGVLLELCRGYLEADRTKPILQHVDQCADCQFTIDQFAEGLVSNVEGLGEPMQGDSALFRERLRSLQLSRPSPQPGQPLWYRDVEPWIDEGDTEIGQVGHYDLIRCIGRGGMGIVFEAFDRELQRPVALKLMSPSLLADATNSERFLREARAAAAINHPAVVAIYAVSKVRDLPYLVMELVDGESLQQRLARDHQLDVDTTIDIALQLAEGLAAAHECGVIHRDIKPANILIQSDDGGQRVKLTDFGLAQTISQTPLTQTGTLLGTPEFLAPEQIKGDRVDHRSDLFSLGSVIYHICVGHPPFTGESIISTLSEVASAEAPHIDSLNRSAPKWLSALVEQLHAKEPDDRPSDAREVASVLRSKGERAISVSRRAAGVTTWQSGRKGWIFIAVGIAIAGLLSSTYYFEHFSKQRVFVAKTADELQAYLAEHDGDVSVELAAERFLFVDGFEFEQQDVEIFAADDMEAELIFRLSPEDVAMRCLQGSLTLRGVTVDSVGGDAEFHEDDEDEDEEFEPEALICCIDSQCLIDGCVISARMRGCVEVVASDAVLQDSTFHCESQAVVLHPDQTSRIVIESSEFYADTGIGLEEPTFDTFSVNGSRFETEFAIELSFRNSDDSETNGSSSIIATGNNFDCDEAVIAVFDVPTVSMGLSNVANLLPVQFRGSDNQMPDIPAAILYSEDDSIRTVQRFP